MTGEDALDRHFTTVGVLHCVLCKARAPGPLGPGKGRREAGSVWVAPARQGGGLEPRPDVAVGWGT